MADLMHAAKQEQSILECNVHNAAAEVMLDTGAACVARWGRVQHSWVPDKSASDGSFDDGKVLHVGQKGVGVELWFCGTIR